MSLIVRTKFFPKPRVSKDSSPFSGRVIEFALAHSTGKHAYASSSVCGERTKEKRVSHLALVYHAFRGDALNPFCVASIPRYNHSAISRKRL